MAERLSQFAHVDFLELFKAGDLDERVSLYEDNPNFFNTDGSTDISKAAI